MPSRRDDLADTSGPSLRGGPIAALVYGVVGVMTVVVVHAALDRGAAKQADAVAAVTQAATAATAVQDDARGASLGDAVADEAWAMREHTLVVSAAPRRMVRVGASEKPTRATNPLLQRSRPMSAQVLHEAAKLAQASQPQVLALPSESEALKGPSALSPYVGYGRLYGAPGGSRIVYLIDASGSQVDTLPFVQQAMQQAVRSLRSEQSYTVLFFNGKAITEAGPAGMQRATNAAVTQTDRFIDPQAGRIVATGRADARAAIRRALAYHPDTVVLLSDGLTGRRDPLGDRAGLLSLIDAANVSGARFHTLQVRQPDPLATPQRRGTLELIASRTGGTYRFVTDDQLPVR